MQQPSVVLVAHQRTDLDTLPESLNPVMPFAPVVHAKSVPYNFAISLHHAAFSFDTSKKPMGSSADWRPSRAIASWEDRSSKRFDFSETSFSCSDSSEAGACNLKADWSEGSSAAANFTKKLKQKADTGSGEYEDQFIKINFFAAKHHKLKSTLCFDEHSKPITLGGPFLINLSVRFYSHPTALTWFSQSCNAASGQSCY